MSDETRIWRLGLPDDWEPEGYWCVSFQIPAGDQYVDALAAVLGLLTISKTFDRDETHTGASIVAKTWKRAIMLQPMQVSETCAIIPPIPIPDDAAAADASAAIFTQFYQLMVRELNTCAPTGADCAACVDDLYASLVPYGASEAVRGALSRLCADLNALSPSQREAYEDDCLYLDEFQYLSDQIGSNPYDWLNKLSSWLFDWLNNTSDAIIDDLNTLGGLLTGQGMMGFVQDNGGIPSGGGADFGSTCPWEVTIDLTVTSGGFVPFSSGGSIGGIWDSGQGWRNGGSAEEVCYIRHTLPQFTQVTKLSFRWTETVPVAAYQGAVVRVDDGSGSGYETRNNALANVPATLITEGSQSALWLQLQINIIDDVPQSFQRVVECVVAGIGYNPFDV